MSFLKAEWRKLAIANYTINPAVLKKYIPYKTELECWNNTCYVSLVGFRFINTKLLGLTIPFHSHFEEVNLRFYVRHKSGNEWKRGVVFIKEIVPKPALSIVANLLYKENYVTMPMKHQWDSAGNHQVIAYQWKYRNKWQTFRLHTKKSPIIIDPNSEAAFITEHYWGYTKVSDQKTYEYEVTHPKWEQYLVQHHKIEVNFGLIYGSDFAFLDNATPTSVMLAEGSEITVEGKKTV